MRGAAAVTSEYAWRIDQDHLDELDPSDTVPSCVGATGPHDMGEIGSYPNACRFSMYDDDGVLYISGVLWWHGDPDNPRKTRCTDRYETTAVRHLGAFVSSTQPTLRGLSVERGETMRTAVEALFDAMVTGGWADEASGDVESPTGHFARLSIVAPDARRALDAFADVVSAYGTPSLDDITGHFLVRTDSQGFLSIERYDSVTELKNNFEELESEYGRWDEG
jgi:hypothetical protein